MKIKFLLALIFSVFFLLYASTIKNVFASIDFDPNYGISSGYTVVSFGQDSLVSEVLLQTDGRQLVLGNTLGVNRDWVISRYDINGIIDTTFGNNGTIIKDTNSDDSIIAAALQPDGKIVVGGYFGPNFIWALGRYNSDGTLDTGFGLGGTSQYINGLINELIIQPDGKIIAAGYFRGFSNGRDDVAIVRYDPNGSLDISFGGDGIVTTQIGSSNDRGNAAVLQSDGKIVVLGDFDAGGHDEIFLVRYDIDGSLDTSFGVGGKVITQFGSNAGARDIVIQLDGKIVITGVAVVGGFGDTYVARYHSNGTLDLTFGVGGKVINSFSPESDYANSIMLQPDGKIIIAGASDVQGLASEDFMLARFNTDGSLDTTFGTDGLFTTPIGTGRDIITNTFLQSDGKIVAVGNTHNGSYNDWVIARFSDEALGVNLEVPLYKQTDSTWGGDLYDSADRWATGGLGISEWGCAVTSAAMVFNYHGLEEISVGEDLNPGTLNEWLKNQSDGYVRNGLTNWLALTRLSRQIAGLNGIVDFDVLEFEKIFSSNTQLVKDNIDLGYPDILREPGHFVVSTGYNDTTIQINDPYYARTDLSKYSDLFENISRFTPASSDLSYIMLVIDETVEIAVFDENDDEIGDLIIEEPITDPAGSATTSAKALKVIYIPKPESGNYLVELSGIGEYLLDSYLYDENGDAKMESLSGELFGNTRYYQIIFDKDESSDSEVTEKVTFDSLIDDINYFRDSGEIKSFGVYISLLAKANAAKGLSYINTKASKNVLRSLQNQLKAQKGKKIGEDAYDVLSQDVQSLRS